MYRELHQIAGRYRAIRLCPLAPLSARAASFEVEETLKNMRSTTGRYVTAQHAMIAVHISTPDRMAKFTLAPA